MRSDHAKPSSVSGVSAMRRRRKRLHVEPLEARAMLAVLGMGIQLRLNDDNGTPNDVSDDQPGAIIANGTPVELGDLFWVDVLVEDKRANPPGVIALPVNFSWDPAKLQMTDPPTAPGAVAAGDRLLTGSFVLQRFVDDFDAAGGHVGFPAVPPMSISIPSDPNIENLRGAAAPNVPGSGSAIAATTAGGLFSQLQFRALATAGNTPFSIELAGSMSFTDAAALDGIAALTSPTVRQQRSNNAAPVPNQEELAVTEFIQIVETPRPASLSGYVYVDTNPTNRTLDRDGDGVAVEFGIPNVTIQLFRDSGQLVATTTTGADGGYLFDNLDADVYRIVETQPPAFFDAGSSVGTILSENAVRGIAGVNQISEIRIALDQDGIDYNFGEIPVPDKRMFLARTDMRLILAGQREVTARTVTGTAGDDTIVVEALENALVVTVNNSAPQQFPIESARLLYVDAKEGHDTVQFIGTAAAEVAQLSPGIGTQRRGTDYSGANYAVMAVAAEEVIADAGSGDDLVVLRDTPHNDALVAAGPVATLATIDNRLAQAIAFDRARALTTDDQDTADVSMTEYVLDLEGNWILI